MRDGRFGIACEHLHLRLVPVHAQYDQLAALRPSQPRVVIILPSFHRGVGGRLYSHNTLGSHIIDADRRVGILAPRFWVPQTLFTRILGVSIDIPRELRHLVFIQPHKRQLFGVRTPGKESGRPELLLIQPIGNTVDDIRVLVLGHRHFGTEIALMDIEVIIFGKGDIAAVRTHHGVPHFTQVHPCA